MLILGKVGEGGEGLGFDVISWHLLPLPPWTPSNMGSSLESSRRAKARIRALPPFGHVVPELRNGRVLGEEQADRA